MAVLPKSSEPVAGKALMAPVWYRLFQRVLGPVSDFALTLFDDADATTFLETLGVVTTTYTPTLVNGTNVDASTAYLSPYLQVDNYVLVFMPIDIDCAAAGGTASDLGIPLPIASDFLLFRHCLGVMTQGGLAETGEVIADTTNNRAQLNFAAQTAANHRVIVAFWYVVL